MSSLLNRLIEICLLKAGPQDLPASRTLTMLAVGLYWLTAFAMDSFFRDSADGASAPTRASISTLLFLGLTWAALIVRRLPQRFDQTVFALAGTSVMVSAVLAALLAGLPQNADAALTLSQQISLFGLTALYLWAFIIDAHIFRHALDIPFWGGLLVSLGLTTIAMSVFGAL